MIDLLNRELRTRDLRKVVEPYLHNVSWKSGHGSSSEWIVADSEGFKSFVDWLNQNNEDLSQVAVVSDKSWLHVKLLPLIEILDSIEEILKAEQCLIVQANRKWVLEFHPNEVLRYGSW